jgi:uncharacterized protein
MVAQSSIGPVDFLSSHNSPKGIHDRDDDIHCGYAAINQYIARFQSGYVIHGHQHLNIKTTIGCTCILGVYGAIVLDTDSGTTVWSSNN